jgi:hypothetical protein
VAGVALDAWFPASGSGDRAVGLAVLHGHPAAVGVVGSGPVSYLTVVGRPLAAAVAVFYVVRAVVFLVAGMVAVCTKNDNRREACVEIVRVMCLGWAWRRQSQGPGIGGT